MLGIKMQIIDLSINLYSFFLQIHLKEFNNLIELLL